MLLFQTNKDGWMESPISSLKTATTQCKVYTLSLFSATIVASVDTGQGLSKKHINAVYIWCDIPCSDGLLQSSQLPRLLLAVSRRLLLQQQVRHTHEVFEADVV